MLRRALWNGWLKRHSAISVCCNKRQIHQSIRSLSTVTPEPLQLPNTISSSSSVLNTVHKYRQQLPNCVLLVRVGDFYELYYDQADHIGGSILGLQVVDKKFRQGAVRFTGFPARSLLRYLELLVVRHGQSVALCEQFQEPLSKAFTRKVTRIITPGTLIDDQCLADTRVHNYILSIARVDKHRMEYQQRVAQWRSQRHRIEEQHRQMVDRILATARRDWEQEQQAVNPKRRKKRGRPSAKEKQELEDIIDAFPEFDPDSVELPSIPEIPPKPTYMSDNSTSEHLPESAELCLAWLDLATGDFMTCVTAADDLVADLARIQPREILVSEEDHHEVRRLVSRIYPSINSSSASSSAPTASFMHPMLTKVSADSFNIHQIAPTLENGDDGTASVVNNPNVYWSISAPSKRLVSSPEHLLLAASELSAGEQTAACGLLNYVLKTQFGLLPPLQPPTRFQADGHLRMSAATIQALELLRPLNTPRIEVKSSNNNSSSSGSHTLLSEIDLTKTNAGGRLLAKRLSAPSTNLSIIEQRLDLIEFFCLNPRVRDQIYQCLDNIGDVERAINKLSLNCGGPRDLLDIARTLREVSKIKGILRQHLQSPHPLHPPTTSIFSNPDTRGRIFRRQFAAKPSSHRQPSDILDVVGRKMGVLKSLDTLAEDVESKIRPESEQDVRLFGFLKPNCSQNIIKLHTELEAKDLERKQLQMEWQQQYSCSTLKLDSIPALGHFIEVSKKESDKLLEATDNFQMIQSLKSKVRFENSQWTYLLSEIEMLRSSIQTEELRIFEELRDSALESSLDIRTNSKVLADMDVAISMSMVAMARQYVRPRFVTTDGTDGRHVVVNGRHPVIESRLLADSRQYVGNDCAFSSNQPDKGNERLLLLTGPNMGGKSTYLRQTALISILAQVGSYVPADDAQLHLVDAIYSRIGAHDNLALDQSTFMVEMSETAEILKHATTNSLVILDEIGRGTSTSDGVAIAYATLKYLHDKIRCKAIFATHYHELVRHVVPEMPRVKPLQTAMYENGGGRFAFLHKVKPGICERSHALYVAQIAGIPKDVLRIARDFAKAQKN